MLLKETYYPQSVSRTVSLHVAKLHHLFLLYLLLAFRLLCTFAIQSSQFLLGIHLYHWSFAQHFPLQGFLNAAATCASLSHLPLNPCNDFPFLISTFSFSHRFHTYHGLAADLLREQFPQRHPGILGFSKDLSFLAISQIAQLFPTGTFNSYL